MRPEQAGKGVTEVAKAAGVAWNSLTQEEKDVSPLFPSELRPSAIDIETSFSNTDLSSLSQLLPRKTPKVSEPSGSLPILVIHRTLFVYALCLGP